MVRPTLIDMNPVELKYYPFMISLDKCTGSCNALSPTLFVPKETKDINVIAFNMITNKNETETMTKNTSCDCNWNLNRKMCTSNQKWTNKTCQCECQNYHKCEKDYKWNPSPCICENSKILKGIADTSLIECDKIITVMDTVSTKMTNNIVARVMNTASINCHSKKVRGFYISHTVLLVIILILVIIITYYYYEKQKGGI